MLALAGARTLGYTTITDSAEVHTKLSQGFFGLIIDTRAQSEWNAGHLPNATFIEALHNNQDTSAVVGCESCNIGVYCHSGVRSKQAADVLEAAGFPNIFDIEGIVQWQNGGHALVTTPSHVPGCSKVAGVCAWPHLSPPPSVPGNWPPQPPPSPLPPVPSPPPPRSPAGASPTTIALAVAVPSAALILLGALALWHWHRRGAASKMPSAA